MVSVGLRWMDMDMITVTDVPFILTFSLYFLGDDCWRA